MTRDNTILIKNIYYMLSYAFNVLNQSNYEYITKEKFDNIHNLFAAIMIKGIEQQLKQGLYREYTNKKEDISVLRGKIDISGTVRNKLSRKQLLTCEYDELSENNIFNKIIKTTVALLLGHGEVDNEKKSKLRKEMIFFLNVDTYDPRLIKWSSIQFKRNNQMYVMLISLCQFLLKGMLLTTEKGNYKMATFIDEQRMCNLYEKFIFEYYKKEFKEIDVKASYIDWSLDDDNSYMLPKMKSDITLMYDNKILIIDAKYYKYTTKEQYDSNKLHSNNLYQIFSYVKNKDSKKDKKYDEVSGMLLYAKTDEGIHPNNSYQMSGNKISVKTLDLNCDFENVRAQLNEIIKVHFGVVK